MVTRTRSLGLLSATILGLLAAAVPGCAAPEDEADSATGALSKPELQARFADMRKINTHNLSTIAVNAGAERLNKALAIKTKYVELGVTVAPTNVFGKTAEENSVLPANGKVKSIEQISSALATELGEREFPVELAKLRLSTLAAGHDKYFVETGFGVRGAVGFDLSHAAGGFGAGDTSIHVGFKKGSDLSARVVVATPEANLKDLLEVNGEAISALRAGVGGFVVPEKAEQILKMKPGEAFGLSGQGTFAANFGVGVPIMVANAGPFAYTLAVSAGLSHAVNGVLDVQLVRLGGDEVAVDVGISEAQLDEQSLGISGGWGINDQCDDGARCLDAGIGKIVRNGLAKRLGAFVKTSVRGSASQGAHRLELARARFHLNQPEVAGALEQALHGDLRYAQALYTRGLDQAEPPVKFDFDMMRASMTNTRSFGAEVFGLDVYHRVAVEKSGSFAVQTPDGVQSVLWSSFQKNSGWFQMDHGSKLTAISSAALDAKNPDKAVNRANFIVQSVVGDKHMDDDVLLDSADALIASLVGKDALAPLDTYGTPMQEAVGRECPVQHGASGPRSDTADRDTWDEACNVALIQDESKKVVQVATGALSLVDARRRGVEAFKALPEVAAMPPAFKDLLASAAELRLTLQMVKVHALDTNNGPGVSFALDYRLDDKALGLLAKADEDKYRGAVERYLAVVSGRRAGIDGATALGDAEAKKAVDAMVARLQRFKGNYRNLSENESQDLPRLLAGKPYVNLPIGIRFDVSDVADVSDAERMKQYLGDVDRIRVESISHQRAMLGKELFDGLAAAADKNVGFSNGKQRLFGEQAAAYPLLAVLPAANIEVGMDLAANVESTFWAKRERFIKAGFSASSKSARGADVEPITGKLFDLQAMMAK